LDLKDINFDSECKNSPDINTILKQKLSEFISLVDVSSWKKWDIFLKSFLIEGGVIEATLNGDDGKPLHIQFPTIHLLILPNGEIQILGSSSMIFPMPYRYWGSIFPQQSLPTRDLDEASRKIGG
jgi:hypothetical protein